MKRIFIFISITTLLNLIFIPAVFSATGQEVLNGIQNRYEKTNDIEADFTQEYISKLMKQPTQGKGKIYLKKKGMMRWDYTVPDQKLISDGHTLWFYQPGDKQVFLSNLSIVLKERTPLAFLAGEGDLHRDFKILGLKETASPRLGAKPLAKEERYFIELAPKEPIATLAKLALAVDKKTYTVLQAEVFDAMGNVTRTRFINIRTNVGLSDSLFRFVIPPGTEEIPMQSREDVNRKSQGEVTPHP